MTSKLRSLLALSAMSALSLSMLGACASTPDPAEVCTAEWISARSEKAIGSIEKRAKSSLKSLTGISQTLSQGKTPGVFQALAFSRAMGKMKKELTNGQGIKDLKTVASTCNDPNIVKDAMNGLMKRQGMSDSFITRIESFPLYQSLITSVTAPEPVNKG